MRIETVDPYGPEAIASLERYFVDVSPLLGMPVSLAEHPTPPSEELRPPRGAFFLARDDAGAAIGCAALTTLKPGIGYVSRMWVASIARGHGVGRALLRALEAQATDLGHRKLRLYTHRNLHAAQALYRASGFVEVDPFFKDAPFADVWFEKELRT